MPDWKQIVRERLAALKLDGAREAEVIEELSQHRAAGEQLVVTLLQAAAQLGGDQLAFVQSPRWRSDGDRHAIHYVGISEPDACVWRAQNRTLDGIAFFTDDAWNLSGFGPAQRVHGDQVTRDMMDVPGLRPFLGRNFTADEDKPHGPKVVLLGYHLWQRLFHGDRGVVGRLIRLSDVGYTVIGVLPKEAVFPNPGDMWVPLGPDPNSDNGMRSGG